MTIENIFKYTCTVVGFIIVTGLLFTMLGGLIGFTIHIILPLMFVVWLSRFFFKESPATQPTYKQSH